MFSPGFFSQFLPIFCIFFHCFALKFHIFLKLDMILNLPFLHVFGEFCIFVIFVLLHSQILRLFAHPPKCDFFVHFSENAYVPLPVLQALTPSVGSLDGSCVLGNFGGQAMEFCCIETARVHRRLGVMSVRIARVSGLHGWLEPGVGGGAQWPVPPELAAAGRERVLAMYPCRARHGALVPSVEGTLTTGPQRRPRIPSEELHNSDLVPVSELV